MRILFLSDNFPPESNAPATRLYEHAVHWVRAGHHVTVLTCAPNFPEGKVFPEYRNRWYFVEEMDGIRVVRVKTYITANEGFLKRTLDYMSFMVAAFIVGLFQKRPDVIAATSPHQRARRLEGVVQPEAVELLQSVKPVLPVAQCRAELAITLERGFGALVQSKVPQLTAQVLPQLAVLTFALLPARGDDGDRPVHRQGVEGGAQGRLEALGSEQDDPIGRVVRGVRHEGRSGYQPSVASAPGAPAGSRAIDSTPAGLSRRAP